MKLANHLSATDRRVWVLVCAILMICVFVVSCIKKDVGGGGFAKHDDPDGGDPYWLVGYEIENAHFETPNLVGPVPAFNYWLKKGDELAVRWDSFEMHWQREGTVCDFLDNTPISADGQNCLVCNLCDYNGRACLDGRFPGNNGGGIEPGFLEVWREPGFMPSKNPESVYSFAEYFSLLKAQAACPDHTPMTFTPEKSGLYRIGQADPTRDPVLKVGESQGKAKIFVVDDANPNPTTTYRLTNYREGIQLGDPCGAQPTPSPSPHQYCPGCVWLKTQTPTSAARFREDSFSPNLHITKVRVLKGTPSVDPITGRFQIDKLTATPVHPTRIITLPASLDLGGHDVYAFSSDRCYANDSEDGDIDLTRCRYERYNLDCTAHCVHDATPQYHNYDPGRDVVWFVEFDPADHGVIPALNCGEVLAIEFTLERI
jgi:hypothetical protein